MASSIIHVGMGTFHGMDRKNEEAGDNTVRGRYPVVFQVACDRLK